MKRTPRHPLAAAACRRPNLVRSLCVALVGSCWLAATQAAAQVVVVEPDPDVEQPTTYRMTVSPAAEPRPALKYRFLTPPVDQIKGNAATFYYKAMSFEGTDPLVDLNKYLSTDEDDAAFGPLDKFPYVKVAPLVQWLGGTYGDWLRSANRCRDCDWEDGIREHGIATLLPQAQKSRSLARAILLRARMQIIDGEYDDAVNTLAINYALSQNLGRSPTLVQCLVGIAIRGMTDHTALDLIAAEGSPNLYWALSDVAAHPVDIRQAMSYESKMVEFTIPELKELEHRIFSPEEIAKVAERLSPLMHLRDVSQRPADGAMSRQLTLVGGALLLYPQAKEYLLKHGATAQRIEAMPVLQTVILYWWKQFEFVCDDTFKWFLLPGDELQGVRGRAESTVKQAVKRNEGGVFTSVFLPALGAMLHAQHRSQRQTAILRVVEALRMHAAETGGWPEKLDDVRVVPVPLDPWTGEPFVYSLKDGVAILEMSPTPPPAGGVRVNHRYELTLRKAKQ